jgi:hypothetical protein
MHQSLPSLRHPLPHRGLVLLIALAAALVFIAVLSVTLKGRAAVLLLDYGSTHFPYPLTIQNLMWVGFFIGLGELYVRWRSGVHEMKMLKYNFLPEDEVTVLQPRDLGHIRQRIAGQFDGESGFVPSLINLAILQFQASRSVDQAASITNNHLELIAHRVDMRYGIVRFIAWLVPTLGFIGTVYALGASLADAGSSEGELNIKEIARTLGVGFDCTMVALMQSAVLVFLMQLVQETEETAVNLAGDYTLRNLINRLYPG